MTRGSWLGEKCGNILSLSHYSGHTSTPLRRVKLSKEWQRVLNRGKSETISLLCHTIPHFPHLCEVWKLSKEWQRVHDWGKVRQYPYFVGLFHTSTPLRSVELSKKWRNSGFHGQGWTWLSLLGFNWKAWHISWLPPISRSSTWQSLRDQRIALQALLT